MIGRTSHLQPLDRDRLSWRRDRVVVDSKRISCTTFDELHNDLRDRLKLMGVAEVDQELVPSRARIPRHKSRKRPDSGTS